MCGRIDQHQDCQAYLDAIGWTDVAIDSQQQRRHNVMPGTYVPLLHIADGEARMDDTFWGYRPAWAANAAPAPGKKKIAIAINARIEKLAGAYWKPLLRAGRAVACASGWYEWTGEKGHRQPWHIRRKDGQPLFLLALARFGPFHDNREESGFALVTADAAGGMVDIHDRRPIAVSADDARRWLDPTLSVDEALQIARTAMLDADLFEWHPVGTDLNRGSRQAPQD